MIYTAKKDFEFEGKRKRYSAKKGEWFKIEWKADADALLEAKCIVEGRVDLAKPKRPTKPGPELMKGTKVRVLVGPRSERIGRVNSITKSGKVNVQFSDGTVQAFTADIIAIVEEEVA